MKFMNRFSKHPLPRGIKLLKLEKTGKLNNELFIVFKMLRSEGVTDIDILSWWNLSNSEQAEIIQKDINLVNSFKKTIIEKANCRLDDVFVFMEQVFPQYVQYSAKTVVSDTSPLPYELKKRVQMYFEMRSIEELNKIRDSLKKYPNMNAYVRYLIRNNELAAPAIPPIPAPEAAPKG